MEDYEELLCIIKDWYAIKAQCAVAIYRQKRYYLQPLQV